MDYTIRKRSLHEKFLENVPILASLTPYERAIIADALEPYKFVDGQIIIRQGEEGDKFYMIEEVLNPSPILSEESLGSCCCDSKSRKRKTN
jgi:hypothetical protein